MPRPDHLDIVRRRVVESRVLTAVAVLSTDRNPTFEDIARDLRGISQADLIAALEAIVSKGLVAVDETPSPTSPLFAPKIVRYRPIGLRGGDSLTSKAGA